MEQNSHSFAVPFINNTNLNVEPVHVQLNDFFDKDDVRTEYIADSITLPVINKRTLGKVLVKICGNEGTKNTRVQAMFRKLFQTTIDYIEKENDTVWTNAEITHYDSYGNTVVVAAGKAQHKFTVQINGKDEIQITSTGRPGFISSITCAFWKELHNHTAKRAIDWFEGIHANGQWPNSHTK